MEARASRLSPQGAGKHPPDMNSCNSTRRTSFICGCAFPVLAALTHLSLAQVPASNANLDRLWRLAQDREAQRRWEKILGNTGAEDLQRPGLDLRIHRVRLRSMSATPPWRP